MITGFIGLGAMGAPMTARLAQAFPGKVHCFDIDPATTTRVAANSGATAEPSLSAIAANCDVLFTCVPNNAVLSDIYLRSDGIAASIRQDTVTVDCSTVGPDATAEVYASLKSASGSHLDASMLGSVNQATEGSISFVVGGDADAFEKAEPALAACGQMIRHCGPTGSGNHMKLIHQTLVIGHAMAVAEAIGLCLETGADIELFYDIVTQGTGFGYSRYFENRVPRMRDSDFSPLFMLKFMLKGARLARDMTPDADRKYPGLAAAIQTLEEAEAAGWGEADFSAAMKAVENRTGTKVAET